MQPDATYDLVVIGAGPAGEKGAATAALFGKRVAIVERAREVGGAATNTGTLPSKTLRETALALSGLRSRALYGVDLSLRREATVADFMRHEKHVTANERARIRSHLARPGIELIHGAASFADPHTIRVAPDGHGGAERLLRGEVILIATGSAPVRPPEFEFDDERICDSDEILHLKHLPRRLVVVGSGVIGSEYACTFAALGAQVHVVDPRTILLPFLDREVSQALAGAMERLGIVFHWNERVARCELPGRDAAVLTLTSGATLTTDTVLVAAGRQSATAALDLAAAGLEPGKRGLLSVDAHFRTAVPHIYAAGDVIGHPALASTSMEQARVAMCHAFDVALKQEISPLLPTGIYTIPEVSAVGATEEELQAQGVDYVAGRAFYAQNARGEIIGDSTGFLKLLFRRSDGRLLGVHVMGESASEVIHIGLLAMLTQSDWTVFNSACFNYPTLGDLYKDAMHRALVDAVRTRGGAGSGGDDRAAGTPPGGPKT
jgi:NAD(P) transhydrogenase